jgi:hypothetical protein
VTPSETPCDACRSHDAQEEKNTIPLPHETSPQDNSSRRINRTRSARTQALLLQVAVPKLLVQPLPEQSLHRLNTGHASIIARPWSCIRSMYQTSPVLAIHIRRNDHQLPHFRTNTTPPRPSIFAPAGRRVVATGAADASSAQPVESLFFSRRALEPIRTAHVSKAAQPIPPTQLFISSTHHQAHHSHHNSSLQSPGQSGAGCEAPNIRTPLTITLAASPPPPLHSRGTSTATSHTTPKIPTPTPRTTTTTYKNEVARQSQFQRPPPKPTRPHPNPAQR